MKLVKIDQVVSKEKFNNIMILYMYAEHKLKAFATSII